MNNPENMAATKPATPVDAVRMPERTKPGAMYPAKKMS